MRIDLLALDTVPGFVFIGIDLLIIEIIVLIVLHDDTYLIFSLIIFQILSSFELIYWY